MEYTKDGNVKLNAYEVAAYWWVKRIKNMVDQIKESSMKLDPKRYAFAEIFDFEKLKNKGYRELYLKLCEKIEQRCEGHKQYAARTHVGKNGHEELVSWLSEIMGQDVPSLNIGEIGCKDLTITIIKEKGFPPSTLISESLMGSAKSRMPNIYKPNFVLCGGKTQPKTAVNVEPSEE